MGQSRHADFQWLISNEVNFNGEGHRQVPDDQQNIISPDIEKTVEPCKSIFEKICGAKNWLAKDFIHEETIVYLDKEGDIGLEFEPEEEILSEELYLLKIKTGADPKEKNRLFAEMEIQLGAEFEPVAKQPVPEVQADEPAAEFPDSIEGSAEQLPPLKAGSSIGEDSPAAMSVPLLEDGTPALWAKRTTGREVSPAKFIRTHYGQTREDNTWDPMGLTRTVLGQIDYPLYLAFATWIKRHPEDVFDNPPAPRPRAESKEEALARRLESEQGASRRYRQRKRLSCD